MSCDGARVRGRRITRWVRGYGIPRRHTSPGLLFRDQRLRRKCLVLLVASTWVLRERSVQGVEGVLELLVCGCFVEKFVDFAV